MHGLQCPIISACGRRAQQQDATIEDYAEASRHATRLRGDGASVLWHTRNLRVPRPCRQPEPARVSPTSAGFPSIFHQERRFRETHQVRGPLVWPASEGTRATGSSDYPQLRLQVSSYHCYRYVMLYSQTPSQRCQNAPSSRLTRPGFSIPLLHHP